MEKAHERDLDNLKSSSEALTKAHEIAREARIDSLKDSKSVLERQLAAHESKIATLEAKKDQTIGEKADELMKLKDVLGGLGGEEEEGTIAKLVDVVANSQMAGTLMERLTGGGGAAAQQQPQQEQPEERLDNEQKPADQRGIRASE